MQVREVHGCLSLALPLYFLKRVYELQLKTIFENKPKGKELNKSPDEHRVQWSEIIVVNNSHVPIRNKKTGLGANGNRDKINSTTMLKGRITYIL